MKLCGMNGGRRTGFFKQPASYTDGVQLLKQCGSPPNLKLALSLASLAASGTTPAQVDASLVGVWLAAAPTADPYGAFDSRYFAV